MKRLLLFIGLVLVVAALLVAASEAAIATLSPAITYDRAVYTPERSVLCPGETLTYTNTLTIARPAVIFFAIGWHDAHSQRPVGPEDTIHVRVFTEETRITRARTNPVPNLPPGNYELHVGSYEVRTSAALHKVPFTIADCAERPH